MPPATEPNVYHRNPNLGFRLLVSIAAAAALVAPTAWRLATQGQSAAGYRSIELDRPIVLSGHELPGAARAGDATGLAGVVATLVAWRGPVGEARPAPVPGDLDPATASRAELRDLFAANGLNGAWLRAEADAVYRLKVPHVAVLTRGDGPRFAIVRSARQGYIYLLQPGAGNILMTHDQFAQRFGGIVFAFEDPPQPPGSGG